MLLQSFIQHSINTKPENMKPTNTEITTLSEDILQIAQKASNKKVDMARFCIDHEDPVRLHDNLAIFNISQDEFLMVFNMNANHYFLSPGQILRFGIYFGLDLPRCIALMLKSEWESYFSVTLKSSFSADYWTVSALRDLDTIDRYIPDFKPDIGKYFEMLRDNHTDSNERITYSKVDFIISDLLDGSFLNKNEQIDKIFPDKNISETILLAEMPVSVREEYYRLKEIWNLKMADLEDMLYLLEQKKLISQNLENDYFRTFYKSEIEKSKLEYRIEKYKMILLTMLDSPELTYRELTDIAEDKLVKARKEKNELMGKIFKSRNYIDFSSGEGPTISKNAYLKDVKTLLKKIQFLTHPDTCPNYRNFSPENKAKINKLFAYVQAMKSSDEELYSYSPSMLLYHMPDYDQLLSVYMKVCKILNIDPEHFEIGNRLELLIMKGTPLDELMEFLKFETERIELQLSHLELIQSDYTNEIKARYYRDALDDQVSHAEKLRKEIAELRSQLQNYKEAIKKEFNKIRNE